MLTVAPPRPGKCLTVVATPPSCQPATDSATAAIAAVGSAVNARLVMTDPSTLGMSATGPSVTLMPAARRSRPPACESSRTAPNACWAGAARSGAAHGTVRIGPPSWSTHTSTPRPARRRLRVSARSCTGSVTLSRNRIAPAARPSPRTRRTYSGASVPAKRRITSRPTCCSSVSRSIASSGGGGCSRACGEASGAASWASSPPPAPTATPATSAIAATAASAARRRRTWTRLRLARAR